METLDYIWISKLTHKYHFLVTKPSIFVILAEAGIQNKSNEKDINNNENYRKHTLLTMVFLKKYWIPVGIYPREGGDGNDRLS